MNDPRFVSVSTKDGSMGRLLANMVNPPRVRSMNGKQLATTLMVAQLSMGDRLQPEPHQPKPNAAQRRAAKIGAGKLKVVDGALVGV